MLEHLQQEQIEINDLPPIPIKKYFTIGEVSKLCEVKPHVLRYWEQEFKQLRPAKRRGNRRYYQHKDVEMVRSIRALLYEQGFTINGARSQLSQDRPSDEQVALMQKVLKDTAEEINEMISILEL